MFTTYPLCPYFMFIHTHTRIDSFPVLKVSLASNFLPRVLVLSCPPSSLEEWRQVGKGEGKRGFKVDGGWGVKAMNEFVKMKSRGKKLSPYRSK